MKDIVSTPTQEKGSIGMTSKVYVLDSPVLSTHALVNHVAKDVDFDGADLRGFDLSHAELEGANFTRANFSGMDLKQVDLFDASLKGADFREADLTDAIFEGADMRGADLRGAILTKSSFTNAYMYQVNVVDCDALQPIKMDLFRVLLCAPGEVAGVLAAVQEGQIDGSVYSGECACLVGTIAMLRGIPTADVYLGSTLVGEGLVPNPASIIERWFAAIREGDTPDNSCFSAITEKWIVEFMVGSPQTPSR